jgi:hypothetical protein
MANAILAHTNRADEATLTGGSWLAALPLANLKDRRLSKVARSTSLDLSATQFELDIGPQRLVRAVALVNHNLSLTALYRVTASELPDFSVLEDDSGWREVWPPVYPTLGLPWEAPNWWSGRYLPEEIEGYTWTLVYILSASKRARYWRIELNDEESAAGYVQIGRLFLGDGWQPLYNMSVGASLGIEVKTETQDALSGAKTFARRRPVRVARFNIKTMSEDEALAFAFEIERRCGIDREVLFLWDPDDTRHAVRRQYLGHLRQLSPVEHAVPTDRPWSKAWEIEELL